MSTETAIPQSSVKKVDGRGKHPNSRKNLIPFHPGHQHNPHPGYPLKEKLQDMLRKPLKEPKDDAPAGDQLVYSTLKGAIDLVPVAFNQTWDRVEGKVPGDQPVANQDNRVVNIYVTSNKVKELMNKVTDRLKLTETS